MSKFPRKTTGETKKANSKINLGQERKTNEGKNHRAAKVRLLRFAKSELCKRSAIIL